MKAIGAVIAVIGLILCYLARTYGYTKWRYAAAAGAVFGSFIHAAGKSLECGITAKGSRCSPQTG